MQWILSLDLIQPSGCQKLTHCIATVCCWHVHTDIVHHCCLFTLQHSLIVYCFLPYGEWDFQRRLMLLLHLLLTLSQQVDLQPTCVNLSLFCKLFRLFLTLVVGHVSEVHACPLDLIHCFCSFFHLWFFVFWCFCVLLCYLLVSRALRQRNTGWCKKLYPVEL